MPEGSAPVESTRVSACRGGVEAAIRCAQPPLPPEEARRIARFVGRFLVEEYLNAILLGEFSEEACFTAGLGLVGDSVLATCWSGWGREFPDIAVMGGVATAEAHRGQGLASAVVGAVCERFDSAGGRLLCLGTSNPAARRIYERLGFRQVAGQVFCRAARGARLDEGFAPGRPVAARPASWRDMASIVPLYLLPHPCVLADAGIGLPSARVAEPRRCVRIFWDLWKSIEPAGKWAVLRNDLGWPVASALARPDAPSAAGVFRGLSLASGLFCGGRRLRGRLAGGDRGGIGLRVPHADLRGRRLETPRGARARLRAR